jgi:hypothetical protein
MVIVLQSTSRSHTVQKVSKTTPTRGHRPHSRSPRAFPRATTPRPPVGSNIDVHRSITTLERPHQPDRHPPSQRNSTPPLRRILLPGKPPLSKWSKCGAVEGPLPSHSPESPGHRLRSRIPRHTPENLDPRRPPDPGRIKSQKSRFPPRSSESTNIDQHRCKNRPSRNRSRRPRLPPNQCSNPKSRRAFQNHPPPSHKAPGPPGNAGTPDRKIPAPSPKHPGNNKLVPPNPSPPIRSQTIGNRHK